MLDCLTCSNTRNVLTALCFILSIYIVPGNAPSTVKSTAYCSRTVGARRVLTRIWDSVVDWACTTRAGAHCIACSWEMYANSHSHSRNGNMVYPKAKVQLMWHGAEPQGGQTRKWLLAAWCPGESCSKSSEILTALHSECTLFNLMMTYSYSWSQLAASTEVVLVQPLYTCSQGCGIAFPPHLMHYRWIVAFCYSEVTECIIMRICCCIHPHPICVVYPTAHLYSRKSTEFSDSNSVTPFSSLVDQCLPSAIQNHQ